MPVQCSQARFMAHICKMQPQIALEQFFDNWFEIGKACGMAAAAKVDGANGAASLKLIEMGVIGHGKVPDGMQEPDVPMPCKALLERRRRNNQRICPLGKRTMMIFVKPDQPVAIMGRQGWAFTRTLNIIVDEINQTAGLLADPPHQQIAVSPDQHHRVFRSEAVGSQRLYRSVSPPMRDSVPAGVKEVKIGGWKPSHPRGLRTAKDGMQAMPPDARMIIGGRHFPSGRMGQSGPDVYD